MKKHHCILLFVCFMALISGMAQDASSNASEHLMTEMVPMRDGVKLFTSIELPQVGKKYPVMLVRTLYRSKEFPIVVAKDVESREYVLVTQDVRGSGRSEGDWTPFVQELNDGKDCLDWIAEQPWCDGSIVMRGASYLANTQLLAAVSGHPALKAIAPEFVVIDYFTSYTQMGGVPILPLGRWICSNIVARGIVPREKFNRNVEPSTTALVDYDMAWIGMRLPFWKSMLDPQAHREYWKGFEGDELVKKIQCPAFMVSGWYDVDGRSQLHLFQALRENGANEAVRKYTRCIMGPYDHARGPNYPGQSETQESKQEKCNLGDVFSLNLAKDSTKDPLPQLAPLTYFVVGANEWRSASVWPPEGTKVVPYYLVGGKANTVAGNGALSTMPTDSQEDVFVSDPENPVPSVGGRWDLGAMEQLEPLGERQDVLFYQTQPLTKPLEIAGPVQAKLFFSCSAPETDIAVKLVDVHPDGKAYNVVNGIKRTSTRGNKDVFDEPMVSGKVYELSFEIQHTAHRFPSGHRVMVIIAGQDCGYFVLNHNTGKGNENTENQKAEIHILHSEEYPSAVLLPTQDVKAVKAFEF